MKPCEPCLSRGKLLRETDGEGRARSHPAGNRDFAPLAFDRMLRNSQAQPGSARFARARLVYPVEALEDTRQLLFGNSMARIGDVQAKPASVLDAS